MPGKLILTVFPTFAVGGAQARFATLANHFGRRFRHVVVAMDGNLACRERLDPGLDITFPDSGLRKGDTLGNLRRIRAVLRSLRPDTMLTHNFGAIEWAMANRTGLVRHIHVEDGFGPEERSTQLPRRVWLRRVSLWRRTVVLPSRTLMRIALQTWRLDPAWLRYVPNGVDLARFAGLRPPAPWPGTGPVIGTVGALRPEKNFGRLIRAFHAAAQGPAARLVIIGDGPERPALQALAVELGIAAKVHFAGHIPDPAPLLRAFDIFAMSSDTEQMPLGLLEAMAAGLPVAATGVGDIATMLPPPAQDYVTVLDYEALGAALRRLIEAPGLRRTLGEANRARAEQAFGQQAMFDAWAELLDGRA